MDNIFTVSSLDLISHVAVVTYEDSRRQSERDLPDLGPFRNELMSGKSLKAKEIYSRIYCVFLALSNLFLIEALFTIKGRKIILK